MLKLVEQDTSTNPIRICGKCSIGVKVLFLADSKWIAVIIEDKEGQLREHLSGRWFSFLVKMSDSVVYPLHLWLPLPHYPHTSRSVIIIHRDVFWLIISNSTERMSEFWQRRAHAEQRSIYVTVSLLAVDTNHVSYFYSKVLLASTRLWRRSSSFHYWCVYWGLTSTTDN